MTSVTYILVSLLIAIGGLTLVNIANRREMRSRLITRQVSNVKRKIQDLEELCVSIEPLLETTDIPSIINEEIIETISSLREVASDSEVLDIYHEKALKRRETLSHPESRAELYRAQESDAKMARALYYLGETGKILRARQAKGLLSTQDMEKLLDQLSWSHLMVKVVTHVIEGQKARQRSDIAKAFAFYKKAKHIVMETSLSDDRRQVVIKEIGKLLNHREQDFSPALIPEYAREASESTERGFDFSPAAESIGEATAADSTGANT